jgi:asparagine synthase (glutamine-hydrolysing)
MTSHDGHVTMTFNGEVYNFPQLRRELEAAGVRFRGASDSEVILEAFVHWGTTAFIRFNGMFAIAFWDDRAQTLHLVRDRFGIKPLYYQPLAQGIVFGSEIKALLASGRVGRTLDWSALHEYLYFGHPLRANTMLEGVREVLPGHYLTLSRSGLHDTTYWAVENTVPVQDDLDTATRTVRERLELAVQSHLISDVPVGVFLSGGIDSSAITALASRHYGGRLATYSVGFDFERGVNELPKARRVAEYFKTDHHELHLSGGNMPDVIESLVRCHDEPFGDCADIPLYLLCRELRGAVKVVLQGDGGDEIFAGYRRYNVLSFDRLWRAVSMVAPIGMMLVPRRPATQRAMRFFRAMGHPDAAVRMGLYMTVESLYEPPTRVLSDEAQARLRQFDPFSAYRDAYEKFGSLDAAQRSMYTDCTMLLPDMFLPKVDKSTMAHGIEVRVPFLDVNLTEYALGLPSSLKVARGQKKRILRRALRGIVPDDILDGPKTGFGVPFEHWLRTSLADYARSVLFDHSFLERGLCDRSRLEQAFAEHVSGRRNHGFLIWKLLNLALWMRFYVSTSLNHVPRGGRVVTPAARATA